MGKAEHALDSRPDRAKRKLLYVKLIVSWLRMMGKMARRAGGDGHQRSVRAQTHGTTR